MFTPQAKCNQKQKGKPNCEILIQSSNGNRTFMLMLFRVEIVKVVMVPLLLIFKAFEILRDRAQTLLETKQNYSELISCFFVKRFYDAFRGNKSKLVRLNLHRKAKFSDDLSSIKSQLLTRTMYLPVEKILE